MKNSATAEHFVFLGPCPAARHLVIAFSKSSVLNLFSFPRVLKLILKMRFQNFQNKFPFIQRGEDRALGKFCDPLVSKYDICLIVQEHRLVNFFVYLEISQNLFARAIDMACK